MLRYGIDEIAPEKYLLWYTEVGENKGQYLMFNKHELEEFNDMIRKSIFKTNLTNYLKEYMDVTYKELKNCSAETIDKTNKIKSLYNKIRIMSVKEFLGTEYAEKEEYPY